MPAGRRMQLAARAVELRQIVAAVLGHAVPRVSRRAFGQRGWNAQPDGGATGEGTSPLSTMRARRRTPLASTRGTADSSAAVYGWRGALVERLRVGELDDRGRGT